MKMVGPRPDVLDVIYGTNGNSIQKGKTYARRMLDWRLEQAIFTAP